MVDNELIIQTNFITYNDFIVYIHLFLFIYIYIYISIANMRIYEFTILRFFIKFTIGLKTCANDAPSYTYTNRQKFHWNPSLKWKFINS